MSNDSEDKSLYELTIAAVITVIYEDCGEILAVLVILANHFAEWAQRFVEVSPHHVAGVLARLDPLDDLPIYELRTDGIHWAVVPGREHLLAERKPPGGVLLLLALGHFIQHMSAAAAQGRRL